MSVYMASEIANQDFSEVFHEKKGFDIVIANPPYVFTRKKGFTDSFKKYVKDNRISSY